MCATVPSFPVCRRPPVPITLILSCCTDWFIGWLIGGVVECVPSFCLSVPVPRTYTYRYDQEGRKEKNVIVNPNGEQENDVPELRGTVHVAKL